MGTLLKIGDKAPEIRANDQHGVPFSLQRLLGKKVIIYFYPKDSTPGCTQESCDLRDNYAMLQKQGFEVIGISADNEKSHLKFIKKYQLPFTLIADTEKTVVNDYSVYGQKTFWGKSYMGIYRTTFIIDEKGIIEEIIEKVETKNHTNQIIETLKQK